MPSPLPTLSCTVPQAAAATGLGTTTIRQLIRTGEIRSFLCGRRRLVVFASLEAFVRDSAA
jgi:excisionase family DNA binding protein